MVKHGNLGSLEGARIGLALGVCIASSGSSRAPSPAGAFS